MPLFEPYLPTRYLYPLLGLLEVRANDTPALAALSRQLPQCRARRAIGFKEFQQLVGDASRALGRTDLAFELGMRVGVDDHEALGVLMRQTRTLDEALRCLVRYQRLILTGMQYRYVRHATYGELSIRPVAAMDRATLHAIEELVLVSTCREIVEATARDPGLEVSTSMPRPAHARRYRELRPARIHFAVGSLPGARLHLPLALLERPLLHPHAGRHDAVGPLGNFTHPERRARNYAGWIAMVLNEVEGHWPTLDELASILELSARTLKRYLREEAASFSGISARVRQERAAYLLQHTAEPVHQIASRLGYASPEAFFTAFRRGARCGPRAWRAAARASASPVERAPAGSGTNARGSERELARSV